MTTTTDPTARLERLEGDLKILQSVVASGLPAEKPEDREYAGDLGAWVDGWLLARIERQVTIGDAGVRWCPNWQAHPEAVARLHALRDAWAEARVGPGSAMAAWWIEKADPTLAVLFAPEGPFARCRETHRRLPPLASAPAGDEEAQRP